MPSVLLYPFNGFSLVIFYVNLIGHPSFCLQVSVWDEQCDSC